MWKLILALCFVSACASVETKGDRYGYWVEGKPWRGTRLDNRDYVKPYRQCVEPATMQNKDC